MVEFASGSTQYRMRVSNFHFMYNTGGGEGGTRIQDWERFRKTRKSYIYSPARLLRFQTEPAVSIWRWEMPSPIGSLLDFPRELDCTRDKYVETDERQNSEIKKYILQHKYTTSMCSIFEHSILAKCSMFIRNTHLEVSVLCLDSDNLPLQLVKSGSS